MSVNQEHDGDGEFATLLWNEHKEQQDWQRHNETQRSNFVNILLLIAGAIVTFFPKDQAPKPADWPFPATLCLVGVFGFVGVLKYWERFMFHVRIAEQYRLELNRFFERRKDPPQSFTKILDSGVSAHEKGLLPFPKDRHLMQHWLWLGIFFLFAGVGLWWLGMCRNWW